MELEYGVFEQSVWKSNQAMGDGKPYVVDCELLRMSGVGVSVSGVIFCFAGSLFGTTR